MNDGKQLKYGQIAGGNIGFDHILAVSQAIYDASSKFVYRTGDGTDTVTLAADGTTELLGHMEIEAHASDAAWSPVRKVICDPTAVFRIPINSGTYTHLMKGKDCDISIDTVQGAQLDASVERSLKVIGGDLVNNEWVDVMINYPVFTTIGVDVT